MSPKNYRATCANRDDNFYGEYYPELSLGQVLAK
jgi:hypothetical protein